MRSTPRSRSKWTRRPLHPSSVLLGRSMRLTGYVLLLLLMFACVYGWIAALGAWA